MAGAVWCEDREKRRVMIRVVGDPAMCAKHKERAEGVCPGCFSEVDAARFVATRLLAEALEFGIEDSWKKRAEDLIEGQKT